MFNWLDIYIPFSRLDTGLLILLIIWAITVTTGFVLWLIHEKKERADR